MTGSLNSASGGTTAAAARAVFGTPVRYCPSCGASLDGPAGFVHEYWVGGDRQFHCWCPECYLLCTVVLSQLVTSHEPEH
ncbi:hypothetical protein SAMN06265360_1098 [Haloechinothrix alba]|uniref:Uncharacterized protein n=1 Tax=Haloechinothrix alba TaxID=664784 RepID=A0A238X2K9_9PSEU|nr:hypothetical protein [Haloechinothrix alba]SNR53176.1 hypothetical protein SAMN06265360_1098 [Haloechinothrix alba]